MNDQAQSLRQRLQRPMGRHAKTIAITSGKGGVGKSNFAVNFALELLERGKRVLIFDLDVGMGNIDILLGLYSEKTMIDLLDDNLTIADIVKIGPKGLAYISGGSGLSHFLKMDQQKWAHFFSEYESVMDMYDFIIFDMGAGATAESLSFILAADECFVITTPEPTAITDAYGMIKHIVNNQKDLPIYVVMNRCHSIKEGRKMTDKFKNIIWGFLNKDISNIGSLLEDKIVLTSVKRQMPYILLNPKAKISLAMKHVVDTYMSEIPVHHNKPLTFMDKLKQLIKVR